MRNKRQSIAIVLCVLLLVLPILSFTFIALHEEHVCTGPEHCPICMELHMAEQIITTLKQILLTVAFTMLVVCAFACSPIFEKRIQRVSETLITLKVELLN